jgi:hypothetical protein
MLDIFFGICTTPPSKIKWSTPKSKSMHASNNELGQENVKTATFARTFFMIELFSGKEQEI